MALLDEVYPASSLGILAILLFSVEVRPILSCKSYHLQIGQRAKMLWRGHSTLTFALFAATFAVHLEEMAFAHADRIRGDLDELVILNVVNSLF